MGQLIVKTFTASSFTTANHAIVDFINHNKDIKSHHIVIVPERVQKYANETVTVYHAALYYEILSRGVDC